MMHMRKCAAIARRAATLHHRAFAGSSARPTSGASPRSHSMPQRRRFAQTRRMLSAAVGVVLAAPSLFMLASALSSDQEISALGDRVRGEEGLLTLRLSALLATALYYLQDQRSDGSGIQDEQGEDETLVRKGSLVYRDAVAVLTQMRGEDGKTGTLDYQGRIAEKLADVVIRAGERHHDATTDRGEDGGHANTRDLLHVLTGNGAADALLQYLVSAKPTSEALVQKVVQAIEVLVSLTNEEGGEDHPSRVLGISLCNLGSAFGFLLDVHALRFTDLLRLGEELCRAQQKWLLAMDQQQGQHFHVSPRRVDEDRFAASLEGFFRLLSPEMPSSIKQFSLWALTSMLRNAEQLPGSLRPGVLDLFLGPACATRLIALPRGNQQLQLQAASFMNVVLHLAQPNASLAQRSTYELWMKQIRYWSTCSSNPSLQLESALCLRTLSSHPRGRRCMSESSETMTALYEFAQHLHEGIQQQGQQYEPRVHKEEEKVETLQSQNPRQRQTRTSLTKSDVGEIIRMQNHISRAFRNICTNFQNSDIAIESTFANASSLLHSKRNLPMSRVFRGTLDLNDLPVIGAEEYESSTEFGWIDILTSWTGSPHREVRLNAIDSLVHLAEQTQEATSDRDSSQSSGGDHGAQDHILQAWLTSMLQHIRHLYGGDEIMAVKQVEEIAKLSDELTPGNEKVMFNPAVVDAGAAALAVLAEKHHEELIQQGVIPLMALLGTSSSSSEECDLKTQCSRVIANLVASSCAELSAHYEAHIPMLLLSTKDRRDRRTAWKEFVADHYDVQNMLRQTPSGKKFLRELQQWGRFEDPMRRSSYFRVVKNMEAYRDFVDNGRLEKDIYCEGVHPIVSFLGEDDDNGTGTRMDEWSDATTNAGQHAESESDGNGAPSIDVVFVHGLRGHPFGTWRTDMGNSLDGKNDIWPDILLAKDLQRHRVNARLVTLGYEAGMVSWSSPWPSLTLQERGKVMLNALHAANIGKSKSPDRQANPVVFVTHSMGGILVKKMLLLAEEQAQRTAQQSSLVLPPLTPSSLRKLHDDNLAANTKRVVFLAVPHFGSDLAKGVRSESVRKLIKTHPAIQDLCADHDGRLEDLNDAFKDLGIDCMSIGEARAAPLGFGISAMVVKPESADPGVGSFQILTGSDHMTICKAKRDDEPHYQAILQYILECACDC